MPNAPHECPTMDEVRLEIDALDTELVALFARRWGYVERAWQLKSRPEEAAVPWRIKEVIDKVEDEGRALGLPQGLAATIWQEMIDWAIAHEEAKLRAKMAQGQKTAPNKFSDPV